jgi:TM2 domain-containing membrane protein YozV
MYCTHCGKQINENQAICLNCGCRPEGGNKFCYNCGAEVKEGAEFCLNCGVALKKEEPTVDKSKVGGQDKALMVLLALFLGGLGVHNFMLGETKKGIVRIIFSIITCGAVSWILPLIDIYKMLTDTYEVNPDKYFW